MSASTLTSKGQITVPVEIRRALSLEPGDRLVFELRDDGLRVRALYRRKASQLRGCLQSGTEFVSRSEERAAAARALADRHAGEPAG